MRFKILCLATVAVCSFLGGLAGQQPFFVGAEGGKPKVIEADEVRCRQVTVSAPGATRSVTILAATNAAGVFVRGDDGRAVSIADVTGQCLVGLYSDLRKSTAGCNVALAADGSGPSVQTIDARGKIRIFGAELLGK